MTFAYEKPVTIDALSTLLDHAATDTWLLAGGTDLLTSIRHRTIQPSTVVDIKGIQDLTLVHTDSAGNTTIGAAVCMNHITQDSRFRGAMSALPSACSEVATFAIRNRATIAGNVANASPCADTIPPLCVLGAEVVLQSKSSQRSVPLQQFFIGVRATVRTHKEFIAAIRIPAQSPRTRTFFRKHQRVRGHDLALTNAALLHDPEQKHIRIAIGACSPTPVVVSLDDLFDKINIEEAVRRCTTAIRPISDVRASAAYRTDMTAMLVRRLFNDLST